jgi:hypothetical protein
LEGYALGEARSAECSGAGVAYEAEALGFPPHLALSALDDTDPTIRDAYVGLFRARRAFGTSRATSASARVEHGCTVAEHIEKRAVA